MVVLHAFLRDINSTLTFTADCVTGIPKTAHKIALLVLEELQKALLEDTSKYQANNPNPNRFLMLFSDNNINYITEILREHHHYPDFPPEIPT